MSGEWPKWLHHPGFSPAVISAGAAGGPLIRGAQYAGEGKPAQFPPVIVHNPDDEAWYVSKGYTPGSYDQAKVDQQRIAPKPNGYREVEYPRYEADGSITPDPNPPVIDTREYPKYVMGLNGDEIAHDAEEEVAILKRAGREPEVPVETIEMTAEDRANFAAWIKAGKPEVTHNSTADFVAVIGSAESPRPAREPAVSAKPKRRRRTKAQMEVDRSAATARRQERANAHIPQGEHSGQEAAMEQG